MSATDGEPEPILPLAPIAPNPCTQGGHLRVMKHHPMACFIHSLGCGHAVETGEPNEPCASNCLFWFGVKPTLEAFTCYQCIREKRDGQGSREAKFFEHPDIKKGKWVTEMSKPAAEVIQAHKARDAQQKLHPGIDAPFGASESLIDNDAEMDIWGWNDNEESESDDEDILIPEKQQEVAVPDDSDNVPTAGESATDTDMVDMAVVAAGLLPMEEFMQGGESLDFPWTE